VREILVGFIWKCVIIHRFLLLPKKKFIDSYSISIFHTKLFFLEMYKTSLSIISHNSNICNPLSIAKCLVYNNQMTLCSQRYVPCQTQHPRSILLLPHYAQTHQKEQDNTTSIDSTVGTKGVSQVYHLKFWW